MYSLKLNKHYPFWKKDTSKLDEISKSKHFSFKMLSSKQQDIDKNLNECQMFRRKSNTETKH